MKLVILCLCLASTACAAPSIFHYLPHYAGSRQQVPPSQVRSPFTAGQSLPQPGAPGAYSYELIYPHRVAGGPGGSNAAQSFGFIKYSIPQPPGRQSVEVYYPYDFSQQRIMTNIPPMTNVPQMPNVRFYLFYMLHFTVALFLSYFTLTFICFFHRCSHLNIPLKIFPILHFLFFQIPSFNVNAIPSQDPMQSLQHDQPTQTSQMPAKV
ncbi:uncharacterized protein LOC142950085 [Anarhichas minor]|uniref:uncharacterized protein LOC142950085 n=1 Tax=Anarhichas minor TaxID=65739 RepID=UPI003F740ACB